MTKHILITDGVIDIDFEGFVTTVGASSGAYESDHFYASLAAAIAAATTSGRALRITQAHTIAANLTIGVPVIVDGGSFTVNSGVTLTFTRGLEADWARIFFGAGNVYGLRHVRGEWWGADWTGVADSQPAMQAAANCVATAGSGTLDGGHWFELAGYGRYKLLTPLELTVSATINLRFGGAGSVLSTRFISPSGATGSQVILIGGQTGLDRIIDCTIGDFSIEVQSGSGATTGLQIGEAGTGYQGTWNAATNTPTLTSGSGTAGHFYVVSTAGSTTIDGVSSWSVSDTIYFNGTAWIKQARQQVLQGTHKALVHNVHVDGAGVGVAVLDSRQIKLERVSSWNTVNEAHIGLLIRASSGWTCGDIDVESCQFVGTAGDISHIGVLTEAQSWGYCTGISFDRLIAEDNGYNVLLQTTNQGALANVYFHQGCQLDGDLDAGTVQRGVLIQIVGSDPATIQNIGFQGVYMRGLQSIGCEITASVAGIRGVHFVNNYIANFTGQAVRINGPIQNVHVSGNQFEECSHTGPLIEWAGVATDWVCTDNVLVQASAVTVEHFVEVGASCDRFVLGPNECAAAACSGVRINDLSGDDAIKWVADRQTGLMVKATGSTVYRSLSDRFNDMVWARDYATVGDGVANDTAAIAAAGASLLFGGTVWIHPDDVHLIDTTLVVPEGVKIKGFLSVPGIPGEGNADRADIWTLRSRLVVNTSATIQLEGNSGLEGLFILRKGMTGPENSAASYAGTAITVSGEDTVCRDLLVIGFNRIYDCNGFQRGLCSNIRWDAVNGFRTQNAFDISRWSDLHGWPFGTIDAASPVQTFGTGHYLFRNGTAYDIDGLNDWFEASGCFAYGYLTGFRFNGTISIFLVNCSADNISNFIRYVSAATIASGGTGYTVNDLLTVAGGTPSGVGFETKIRVTSVSGGVITGITVEDAGSYVYASPPSTPNSPTGGTGTGASITLTIAFYGAVANSRGFLFEGATDEISMVQCHAAAQDYGVDIFSSATGAQIDLNGFTAWGIKSCGVRNFTGATVKLSNGFVRGLNTAYSGVDGTGVQTVDPAGRVILDRTFLIEGFGNAIDGGSDAGAVVGMAYVQDGAIANTVMPDVASASVMTLSPNYDVQRVTGTTYIGNINPTFAGHRVTLIFAASVTVASTVAGSTTIILNGGSNFSATADDTLTLVCDGTRWLEVGRVVL